MHEKLVFWLRHINVVIEETDPVHDEDFADVESLLQQFGSNGNWVKVAETPEVAADRERGACYESHLSQSSFLLNFHVFILHFKQVVKR